MNTAGKVMFAFRWRAKLKRQMGRIWPTGRNLPLPALCCSISSLSHLFATNSLFAYISCGFCLSKMLF